MQALTEDSGICLKAGRSTWAKYRACSQHQSAIDTLPALKREAFSSILRKVKKEFPTSQQDRFGQLGFAFI